MEESLIARLLMLSVDIITATVLITHLTGILPTDTAGTMVVTIRMVVAATTRIAPIMETAPIIDHQETAHR